MPKQDGDSELYETGRFHVCAAADATIQISSQARNTGVSPQVNGSEVFPPKLPKLKARPVPPAERALPRKIDVRDCPPPDRQSIIREFKIGSVVDVSTGPMQSQSKLLSIDPHDWHARAEQALEKARRMKPGPARSLALKKAGQLQVPLTSSVP
jgi:hypothetical protein